MLVALRRPQDSSGGTIAKGGERAKKRRQNRRFFTRKTGFFEGSGRRPKARPSAAASGRGNPPPGGNSGSSDDQGLDAAAACKHRGVIAATEAPANLRADERVVSLRRKIHRHLAGTGHAPRALGRMEVLDVELVELAVFLWISSIRS